MREIKFRAWDKKRKIMVSEERLFTQQHDGNITTFFPGNNILMQYTGLKDKNGKEIYEGDIVKQRPLNCDKEKIGVVSIRPTQGVCFGAYPYFVTPCEVIGNLYENPELLKEK